MVHRQQQHVILIVEAHQSRPQRVVSRKVKGQLRLPKPPLSYLGLTLGLRTFLEIY